MRRFAFASAFALFACLPLPSLADEVDDATAAFTKAVGFEPQDVGALDAAILEMFSATGAMRPDGAASPLEKALLAIDAMEAPLPRTRTMLRYGQMTQGDTPVSFVTVERYNLGPAIREMVAQDYGEENTADAQEFGIGPHVEWRIVTMPMIGQTAAVIQAARREIPDDEASAMDCAGRGCLSLDGDLETVREWTETPEQNVNIATGYPRTTESGAPASALAASELSVAAGIAQGDGAEPIWSGPERPEAARGSQPFLFVTIDTDLGQDTNVDAALGQTMLNDDALEEIWVRRNQFAGSDGAAWFTSTVERKR